MSALEHLTPEERLAMPWQLRELLNAERQENERLREDMARILGSPLATSESHVIARAALARSQPDSEGGEQ